MANRKDDIKARLMVTFRVEAEEHLQALTAHLLALDRELPPAEARAVLEATFREVHTLKGAARSVSLRDVEAVCQALESVLSRMTRGHLAVTRPLLGLLPEAVDGVARLLAGREPTAAERELIAANGAVALEKLRERFYDVVLSDLRMPELDRPGLYREVERRHPRLARRFVFLTGDTLSPEITTFLEETRAVSVSKPFAVEEVRRAVERAVRAGARP